MFGIIFYHKTIRNIVSAFGTLFNDISINREESGVQEVDILDGGSGYTNGIYTVAITGNPGSGGGVQLTVSGGIITGVGTITPGSGYNQNSNLTTTAFNLGALGGGAGAVLEYATGQNIGNIVQTLKVPLFYAEAEKYLVRQEEDPNAGSATQRPVQIILPAMSFVLENISYDSSRKLLTINQNVDLKLGDNKTMRTQYNCVPYNLYFKLWIMTRGVEDALHILEQILPFFTPDFTVTIKDNPDLRMTKDIPFIITAVQPDDSWDGKFEDRRTLIWTISFTAKAYLYPPTLDRKAIFEVDTGMNDASGKPGKLVMITSPNPGTAQAGTVFDFTQTFQEFDS
jgi:hypothetical protein